MHNSNTCIFTNLYLFYFKYQPYTITFQTFFPACIAKLPCSYSYRRSLICCRHISSFFPVCVAKLPCFSPNTKKEQLYVADTFQASFQLVCQNFLALTHTEGALYFAGTFQASFQLVCQNFLALTHIEGALYVVGTFQAFFQLVCQNFLALNHKEGALYVAGTFQAFFQLVCQNI